MSKERIAYWDNPHTCIFACRKIHDSTPSCIQVDSLTFESYYYTNAWQTHLHDLGTDFETRRLSPVKLIDV